jgi:hypothetical protein
MRSQRGPVVEEINPRWLRIELLDIAVPSEWFLLATESMIFGDLARSFTDLLDLRLDHVIRS